MFESLSNKLTSSIRNLSGRGKISESNVREAMEDVRRALLEADVHVDVVSHFCETVINDALGAHVTTSLKPGEEMIGIVNQRLIDVMGPVDSHIMLVDPGPTIIMRSSGVGENNNMRETSCVLKEQGQKCNPCCS